MINSLRINIDISDENAFLNYNTENHVSSIVYKVEHNIVPNDNFRGFADGCSNLTGDLRDIFNGFEWVDNTIKDLSYAFNGCSNLTGEPYMPLGTINASYAFCGCSNLTGNPSVVDRVISSNPSVLARVNMFHMYDGCSNLTGSPVIPKNNSESGNMSYAYAECTNLTGSPVAPDTSSLYAPFNFDGTYKNCHNLTGSVKVPGRAENIAYAYYQCFKVTGSPQTGNSNLCNNMAFAFYGCSNITGKFVMPINIINAVSAYDGCVNMGSSTITLTTPAFGAGLVNMANCFKNKNSDVYINLRVHGSNVWNSWLYTYGNSGENSVVGYDFNWVNDASSQRFYNMEAGILVYYNLNFPPKPIPIGNVLLNSFTVSENITSLGVGYMEEE